MDDDIEIDDDQYDNENDQDHDNDNDNENDQDLDADTVDDNDNDHDNDADDDDDEDDEDEDDDDDDDDDDDEDDDDDDDDDEDDEAASATGSVRAHRGRREGTRLEPPSANSYLAKVEARRRLFHPPPACFTTPGYSIEPVAAAPHCCHVHAMTLSLDSNTLLSGGSDGFVRRYDLHATMNGKSMLTQNVRHGFVEGITRGGVLTAWWPNQEVPALKSPEVIHDKDRPLGVVHSLACHSEALWGLSGSESGNIHLWGVRHDPGHTRHVFRRHKGAVSVLTLTNDDNELISGGWDLGVHQWDLNTGQITRSYPGHAGQVSSISFRPVVPRASSSRPKSPTVSIRGSAAPTEAPKRSPPPGRPPKQRPEATPPAASGPTGNDDMDVDRPDNDVDSSTVQGTQIAEAEDQQIPGVGQTAATATETTTTTTAGSTAAAPARARSRVGSKSPTRSPPLPVDSLAEKDQPSAAPSGSASDPLAGPRKEATPSDPAAISTPLIKTEAGADAAVEVVPITNAADGAEQPANKGTEAVATPSSTTKADAAGEKAEDDPTEEELAFEAELNASLGFALGDKGAADPDSMDQEAKQKYTQARKDGASAAQRSDATAVDDNADADADGDEDLFGGETPPSTAAGGEGDSGTTKDKSKAGDPSDPARDEITTPKGSKDESDGDDSLFGDDGDEAADEDLDADGDAEVNDADADADADADGDGDDGDNSSDEDMPLAGRTLGFRADSKDAGSLPVLGRATETPDPLASSSPTKGAGNSGVALPFGMSRVNSSQQVGGSQAAAQPAAASSAKPNGTAPPTSKALPKPSFGGFSAHSGFDDDVSTFSDDVMLTSTLAGQVLLWDRRVKSTTSSDGTARGVRALGLPEKTPPWCASACFNAAGDRIYVGRRNESVDEWDMRMLPDAGGSGAGLGIANPRFVRSLKLPNNSGPVTALAAMPNGRHIICGSYDNVRLWNTQADASDPLARVPFRIVAGHHGAAISQILVDPSCSFLLTASGDRGWMSSSTEALIVHEIKPV